jgi:hypothetical protein
LHLKNLFRAKIESIVVVITWFHGVVVFIFENESMCVYEFIKWCQMVSLNLLNECDDWNICDMIWNVSSHRQGPLGPHFMFWPWKDMEYSCNVVEGPIWGRNWMRCGLVATWFSGELLIFAFGKAFLCVLIYNMQLSSGFNVSLNLLDDCDGLNLYEWVIRAWQNSFFKNVWPKVLLWEITMLQYVWLKVRKNAHPMTTRIRNGFF